MPVCPWCEHDTDRTVSCTVKTIEFPDGTTLPPLTYASETGRSACADCHTPPGGIHHPGCGAERCPRCQGQLLSCGCMDPKES